MGTKIQDIKATRDQLLAQARAAADTASAGELRALSEKVEQAQRDLSAAITEGASPCPRCGNQPVGIEQPAGRGRVEYEIGCVVCKPFEHTDASGNVSVRKPTVRGGMLPSHAVEAWNAGPDFWTVA